MKNIINISIPEPCHENWQAMTIVEKGKFCDSCQKNVFDFTKATDRQIIEAYHKNNKLCGRFLKTQLNRDLVAPKEKGSIWFATTSTLFSLLAFGNSEVEAQETHKTEQTETKHLLGKPAQQQEEQTKGVREITGIVSYGYDLMPGINIVVKRSKRRATTNIDGKYSIKAKEGETLIFSFMGLEDKKIIIGKENFYKIEMVEDNIKADCTIGAMAIRKRRNFIGRTFHKISNWFK